MTSATKDNPQIKISKEGLTKAGVVILQSVFVGFFTIIEIVLRHGVGILTGLAICIAVFGSVRFGRSGTAYASAATTPLAFAGTAFIGLLLQDGPHPSRLGVDFVASLASVAPYLLIAASYGWLNYLRTKNSSK